MKKIVIILSVLLTTACGQQEPASVSEYAITGQKIDPLDNTINLYGSVFFDDTSGSLLKTEIMGGVALKKISTTEGTINNMIIRGRGPTEYIDLNVMDIDSAGNFHAYSNASNMIIHFSPEGEALKTVRVEARMLAAAALGDNFVAYGDFTHPENMYFLCDDTGRKITSFGAYPDDGISCDPIYKAMVYQGKMLANPKRTRFAYLTHFGKIFEIYEILNGDTPKMIASIRENYPVYEAQKGVIGVEYKEMKFHYVDAYATERNIYALYSGKQIVDRTAPDAVVKATQTDMIHVYDWDGNHKCNLVTDIPILNLCVRADDSTIFAIYNDEGEMKICKFDLPEDML